MGMVSSGVRGTDGENVIKISRSLNGGNELGLHIPLDQPHLVRVESGLTILIWR